MENFIQMAVGAFVGTLIAQIFTKKWAIDKKARESISIISKILVEKELEKMDKLMKDILKIKKHETKKRKK